VIILDTNVISELMRTTPDPVVVAWARAQTPELVYTSALTVAEVGYGIARLPPGRRRQVLAAAAEQVFTTFAERVLAFDAAAAAAYGDVVTTRERAGTPISALDAQIAPVTRAHSATLATRNTSDFIGLDLDLVNPWTSPLRGSHTTQ